MRQSLSPSIQWIAKDLVGKRLDQRTTTVAIFHIRYMTDTQHVMRHSKAIAVTCDE